MVSGCFTSSGLGRLTIKENVQPSVHVQKLDSRTTIKNTPARPKTRMKVLKWSVQSLDLNQIETFWPDLRQTVHAQKLTNATESKQFW